MEIKEILEKSVAAGLRITLNQQNLQIHSDAPPAPELLAMIKQHKTAIVAFLQKHIGDVKQTDEIAVVNVDNGFPLSMQQQSLHFIGQLYSDHSQYNLCRVFSYQGQLDINVANQTIHYLVNRHPMLSLRFDEHEGEVSQQFVDLASVSVRSESGNIESILLNEQKHQFALDGTPLIRVIHVPIDDKSGWLLFNLPHRVVDGKSISIVTQEFVEVYQAISQGREASLPALPIRYSDYVAWQNSAEQLKKHSDELHYWLNNLQECPPLHSLQCDFQRPAIKSTDGKMFTTELSAEMNQRIDAFCKVNAVTPFILLQTLMAVLVSRYSGEKEVVIGTPVECRSHKQLENLVGLFANSVAIKSSISRNISFREQLENNKLQIQQAMSNQDVPLRKVVESVNPDRAMSHSPLFQLFFSLDNDSINDILLDSVTLTPVSLGETTSKFDLELMIKRGDKKSLVNWHYDHRLFTETSIASFAQSYLQLLEEVLDNVEVQCEQLDLDRSRVIPIALDQSEGELLHKLIEHQAKRYPDKVAIEGADSNISYKALNEKANQVAHFLIKQKLSADEFVGVCIERSIASVIAILGVLKAGIAYLPIDPKLPQARRQYIVNDAKISLVLSELNEDFWTSVSLSDILQREYATCNPNIVIHPESTAYAIYTSGSTGNPKAAAISHSNVFALLKGCNRHYGLNEQDRVTNFHSTSFDFSVWEIFSALTNGATLYIVPEPLKLDIRLLTKYITDNEITLLSLTPSVFYLFADEMLKQGKAHKLRYVVLGGEALDKQKILPWLESQHDGQVRLINMYGITETTVHVTFHEVTLDSSDASIGVPIDGYEAYVVNEQGSLQPCNAVGELWIAGKGVAKGYLNREQLNRDKFSVVDLGGYSKRVYKTGDLACWSPDGSLRYLGRRDQQIKIRGYRIEPGEVEAAILSLTEVTGTVVDKITCSTGEQLVAFVKCNSSKIKNINEVVSAKVKQSLPAYMVPNIIKVIEEIPVTRNGKVDKQRLMDTLQDTAFVERLPLSTNTEVELANIWKELIGVSQVFADDNFFSLGGHSLVIAKLIALIERQFGKSLSLTSVYENPQLADLARVIDAANSEKHIIDKVNAQVDVEPTPMQSSMWLACQIEENSSKYNIPVTLKLEGTVDQQAIVDALTSIVERHESLRTRFLKRDDKLITQVNPDISLQHEFVDLSDLSPNLRFEALAEHKRIEGERNFDLSSDTLIRSRLLKFEPLEYYLLLTVHHLACDAWSIDILFDEFSQLYNWTHDRHTPKLPKLDIQYCDYAAWYNEKNTSADIGKSKSFWQQELAGAPLVHSLPLDFAREKLVNNEAAYHKQVIGGKVYRGLKELAQREAHSLFNVVQPLIALLLAQLSNEDDILMLCPFAGRGNNQTENLIGLFNQNIIYRTTLSANASFSELISDSHAWFKRAVEHLNIAHDEVVKSVAPLRQYGFTPLCQVALNFLVKSSPKPQLNEVVWTDISQEYGIQDLDLHFTIVDTGEALEVRWLYKKSLFKNDTICNWADKLAALSAVTVNNSEKPLAQWPSSSWKHYEKLNSLSVFPTESANYIHEAVEKMADKFADKVAIVAQDAQLDYKTLNDTANQYAACLIDKGVKPGQYVGICAERNTNFVIAMLAVLKAGGAYVPLVPDLPEDYLENIASDAEIDIILTEQALLQKFNFLSYKRVIPTDMAFRKVLLAKYSTDNVKLELQPTSVQPAYVIYTSGSTGQPKGVEVSHNALGNFVKHDQKLLGMDQHSRLLNVFSFSFDPASGVIFSGLTAGASINICPTHEELAPYIEEHKLTHLIFPTALAAATPVGDWPHVKVVSAGGEACSPSLSQKWGNQFEFFNLYGPTEATIYALNDKYVAGKKLTIGKPISHSGCYIINKLGQIVDVGQVGELVIFGASVGTRYLDNELNEVKYPVIQTPRGPEKVYKTGDLALLNEDGNVEYKGRIDSQLKIHGYRIEPAQVEAQIMTLPEIKEVAVVVHKPEKGEPQLVAYYSSSDGSNMFDFDSHLEGKLPHWMLPSSFIYVEALPLTINGKLDVKALPQPLLEKTEMVLPKSQLEQEVKNIWCEILSLEDMSMSDDFLNVGGSSLTAMVLVNQIKSKYKIDIKVKDLFEHSTPTKFAELLESLNDSVEEVEHAVEMEW